MTPEDRRGRRTSIGGSDANIIAHGTKEQLDRLWLEKRGDDIPSSLTDPRDRDPDSNLPAEMGQWTEELNRRWFTKQTGLAITSPQDRVRHPGLAWLSATLDGRVILPDGTQAVFESKHVNPFTFSNAILDEYMPQLQHNMFVAGLKRAALSVFVGNTSWRHYWVDFDPFWHGDLLEAETRFWECVMTATPPDGFDIGHIDPPSIIQMTGNPVWSRLAEEFITASRTLKSAQDRLRALVPPRAKGARGHGIIAKRDKRGTPRISEEGDGN